MKLLQFLCIVTISQCAFGTLFPKPTGPYDAIYCFGDSISDTGNSLLYGGSSLYPLDKLPYGMTFFEKATGRASDGRLIVDFFAEEFGLTYTIPSLVLSGLIKEKNEGSNKISVNFAVFGATALDQNTSSIGTNASLSVQLDWFKQLKPYLCAPPQDCSSFFKKSLFLVGEIGGNDYNYPLLETKSLKEVEALVPQVVEAISNAVITLIEEGATELVVPGNFPIGCSVVYLTIFESQNASDYDNLGCLKALNAFSKLHNLKLRIALRALRSRYPHAKIAYANLYGAMMRYIRLPKRSGFRKDTLLKACCGGGGKYNYDFLARCGMVNSTVCEDPSTFPNWDGVHLTEAAYRAISNGLLHGGYTTPPLIPEPSPAY